MTKNDVVEEIKLELTGQVLELELDDSTLDLTINKALRELQRYWDETTLVTIPYASCINYAGTPLEESSSIVRVYRTVGVGNSEDAGNSVTMDPMYAQQWMVFSNAGTMYNLQDYVMNYAAWSTLSQVRNTISTDLAFREDKHACKLYINNNISSPGSITVEYIPKLRSVEDIKSDYWKDVLVRMSLDFAKIQIGRIRTKFTQSNALWTLDGDKLLEEGNTDLKELREILRANSNMAYPID